jgi:hypothetical protein
MLGAQKKRSSGSCVKSTPKEEGGGDTVWINCGGCACVSDPTETNYPGAPLRRQAFFVHRTINVLIAR